MHTKISIDIPDFNDKNIAKQLSQLFDDFENRFSTFIEQSEVNKYANGQLALNTTSPQLRQVITLCKKYQQETNGYFTPYFNNKFNPTGIVKSWAIKQAEKYLNNLAIYTYMINAGGDIACSSQTDKKWSIAVANPANPNQLIANISCQNLSIATSGVYERGEHIINPINNMPANELLSVTVMSKDIIQADSYATALFAMGDSAINFASTRNLKVIIVNKNGSIIQN